MARRHHNFGSSATDHLAKARHRLGEAWNDLERMPPTCRGGIEIAARALGSAERAHAELDAVEDRGLRAANNELYGMANLASSAAWKTIEFFAGVCSTPGREAADRPLFSRHKAAAELNPPPRTRRRR